MMNEENDREREITKIEVQTSVEVDARETMCV